MGVPIYSTPACEDGVIYVVDPSKFDIPRRRDGKPDMRYRLNRMLFKCLSHR